MAPGESLFLWAFDMYYYQHNIGDFDKKTRHLTRIERSVYLDMIHLYYTTEQQLSLDVAMICRKVLARTEEEKAAVLAILDEFFEETPGGWFHDRCEEELAAFRKTKSQASAAGRASAAAKEERRQQAINGGSTDVVTPVERRLNDRATADQRLANQPITNNQEPVNMNQEPITGNQVQEQPQQQPLPEAVPASAPAKAPKKSKPAEPGTGKVWAAYATAYWNRYGVEPVRNAMVNAQLSNLVRRIGLADAEHVAAFFLGHQHRFYVEKMHAVGLLLADCEKLRTEWATSSQMTSAKAVQQDRTQTNLDAFGPLLAEARAREAANAK